LITSSPAGANRCSSGGGSANRRFQIGEAETGPREHRRQRGKIPARDQLRRSYRIKAWPSAVRREVEMSIEARSYRMLRSLVFPCYADLILCSADLIPCSVA